MKIVMGKDRYQLVAEVTASIEAGRHDGRSHFDHHGVFEGDTDHVPASYSRIPARLSGHQPDSQLTVTHGRQCSY